MSQVIVPSNFRVSASGGYRGVPCIGVQDWDSRLNVGDGALSIVAVLMMGGSSSDGAAAKPAITSLYWGAPIVVFGDAQLPGTASPLRNCPRNGWGLYWGDEQLTFWNWNNFNGSTASTYRAIRSYNANQVRTCSRWVRVCFTRKAMAKAADVAGNTDLACYLDGVADSGPYTRYFGSAVAIGDVAKNAKLRFFHEVDYEGTIIGLAALCAGIWIYNRALTPAEAANVTKPPGVAGQIDPEDASLVGALVARSYSGAGDWKAIGDRATPRHIVY